MHHQQSMSTEAAARSTCTCGHSRGATTRSEVSPFSSASASSVMLVNPCSPICQHSRLSSQEPDDIYTRMGRVLITTHTDDGGSCAGKECTMLMLPNLTSTRLRVGRCSSATAAMPASVTRRSSSSVSDLRHHNICMKAGAQSPNWPSCTDWQAPSNFGGGHEL
jgi:hypothetical protein